MNGWRWNGSVRMCGKNAEAKITPAYIRRKDRCKKDKCMDKNGPRDPQVIFLPNLVEAYVNHVKNTRSRRQSLFSPIIGQNMGPVHVPMLHSAQSLGKKLFAQVCKYLGPIIHQQLFLAQVCKYLGPIIHQQLFLAQVCKYLGQIYQTKSLPSLWAKSTKPNHCPVSGPNLPNQPQLCCCPKYGQNMGKSWEK